MTCIGLTYYYCHNADVSVRNTEEVLSWLKDSKTRLDCDVSLLSAADVMMMMMM